MNFHGFFEHIEAETFGSKNRASPFFRNKLESLRIFVRSIESSVSYASLNRKNEGKECSVYKFRKALSNEH